MRDTGTAEGTDPLDERFSRLAGEIAPGVRRPPPEAVYRAARRRRARLRAVTAVAVLALAAGAGTAVRAVTADSDGGAGVPAGPAAPSATATERVTSALPTPGAFTDALFPLPVEFPVEPGVYARWRLVTTDAPVPAAPVPCTLRTLDDLGVTGAREYVYRPDGDGEGSVVLMRFADPSAAKEAATLLRKGLNGADCREKAPGSGAGGSSGVRLLDDDGTVWRITEVTDAGKRYTDYGVVRDETTVAVVRISAGATAVEPSEAGFVDLVGLVGGRLGDAG